ncbi:MAG: helix-turn-helix domain-containing protein [Candidatus Limimorpha sp.]
MGKINYLKWRERINLITPDDHRIGSDLLLIECKNDGNLDAVYGPFRSDVSMCFIYREGWSRIRINMKEYVAKSPCIIFVMSGQIFETIESSDNIDAKAIVMSEQFVKSLFPNAGLLYPFYLSILRNPIISIREDSNVFEQYYSMMLNLVSSTVSHRHEAARHLTLAMFYGYGYNVHEVKDKQEGISQWQGVIYSKFLDLLKQHHKKERQVSFYASRLCITPKYLSVIVKRATGRTTIDCIEDYVITEAKAMLSSTSFSIKKIAYELNFPSQSVFGKFFKRVTGISPKQYRYSLR